MIKVIGVIDQIERRSWISSNSKDEIDKKEEEKDIRSENCEI